MTRNKNSLQKNITPCHNAACTNPACEPLLIPEDLAIPVNNTEIPEDENNHKKILTHTYPLWPIQSQNVVDAASIETSEEVTRIYENESIDNGMSDDLELSITTQLSPRPPYDPDFGPSNIVEIAKNDENQLTGRHDNEESSTTTHLSPPPPYEPDFGPTNVTEITKNDENQPAGRHDNDMNGNETPEAESSGEKQVDHPIPPRIIEYNTNNKEDNALERCKRNCNNRVFAVAELLEVCRNDPDSILKAYREYNTHDRDLPKFSGKCFTCIENESDFPSIKHTHGEKFGDPKYHYLMVDASTSIASITLVEEEEEEEEEEKPQHGIMRRRSVLEVRLPQENKKPDELTPESEIEPQLKEDKSETSSITILNTYPSKDNDKRRSNVSWSRLLDADNLSAMTTTDSVEKIVLKATAKADKFRQNVNVKKHYSLLGDIVREEKYKSMDSRKSSSTDKSTESEMPPSKKRYFGFLKGKAKKDSTTSKIDEDKKQKMMDEGEECSETSESKRKSGSSIESYKRRSSPIEHPAFQVQDEISKYLNNITPHKMSD